MCMVEFEIEFEIEVEIEFEIEVLKGASTQMWMGTGGETG